MWLAVLGGLLLVTGRGWADVDLSTYQTETAVQSEDERRRLQADFERQRQEEERRREDQARAPAQRQAEEQARLAARPWPVRLTEAQCTRCHAAANYEQGAHARPGWWLVVLRMRFMNQAPLSWADMWTISGHLAETRPAQGAAAWVEWAGLAGALVLITYLATWKTRRRSRPPKEII